MNAARDVPSVVTRTGFRAIFCGVVVRVLVSLAASKHLLVELLNKEPPKPYSNY